MTELKRSITPTPNFEISNICATGVADFFTPYAGEFEHPNTRLSPDCKNKLLDKYKYIQTLGGGGTASVIEVEEIKTKKRFAVKIVTMSSISGGWVARLESQVLCATSSLIEKGITENYPLIHDVVLCDDVFEKFTKVEKDKRFGPLRYVYMVITKIDNTFEDINHFKFTPFIAFEYVYAYYVLRKYANMVIGDIKWRNMGIVWTKFSRAYHIYTGTTEDVYVFPPGPMFVRIDLAIFSEIDEKDEDDLKNKLDLPVDRTDQLDTQIVEFNQALPSVKNGLELAKLFRQHYKKYLVDFVEAGTLQNTRHYSAKFSKETLPELFSKSKPKTSVKVQTKTENKIEKKIEKKIETKIKVENVRDIVGSHITGFETCDYGYGKTQCMKMSFDKKIGIYPTMEYKPSKWTNERGQVLTEAMKKSLLGAKIFAYNQIDPYTAEIHISQLNQPILRIRADEFKLLNLDI